jgi:hypothetical protein
MIAHLIILFSRLIRWHKRVRDAYACGYDCMQAKLNAYYSGPCNGYDPDMVLFARERLITNFRGSKNEQRSFEEGIRDAVTVYEREHGAP